MTEKDFEERALSDDSQFIDEAESDETVPPLRYDLTSFGADYDVEGVVRRLDRGEIFIPDFQREFVWSRREASRFVESLLLGLPVPGVILAREPETNKLLVIDGQQRLKTLQFFYGGYFAPSPEDRTRRVFKLAGVQERFEGKTYQELDESDRVHLDNSIIHATIVKQDAPTDDDTSIYHIFERLNTGGRRLFPHEIRLAIYYGGLLDLIKELNNNEAWRAIFGKASRRLKDQDLILRFFAMLEARKSYKRPMAGFLNIYASKNRNPSEARRDELASRFIQTIELIHSTIGTRAFRSERALNAATFDSVMVGVAERLTTGPVTDSEKLVEAYEVLLADEAYRDATSRATADNAAVATRISRAIEAFAEVP